MIQGQAACKPIQCVAVHSGRICQQTAAAKPNNAIGSRQTARSHIWGKLLWQEIVTCMTVKRLPKSLELATKLKKPWFLWPVSRISSPEQYISIFSIQESELNTRILKAFLINHSCNNMFPIPLLRMQTVWATWLLVLVLAVCSVFNLTWPDYTTKVDTACCLWSECWRVHTFTWDHCLIWVIIR